VVRVIETQLGAPLRFVERTKPRTESLWNAFQKEPKTRKLYDSLHPNNQRWMCLDETKYSEILSAKEVAAFSQWFRRAYQSLCEPRDSALADKLRKSQSAVS
jgi:hypothetical protein